MNHLFVLLTFFTNLQTTDKICKDICLWCFFIPLNLSWFISLLSLFNHHLHPQPQRSPSSPPPPPRLENTELKEKTESAFAIYCCLFFSWQQSHTPHNTTYVCIFTPNPRGIAVWIFTLVWSQFSSRHGSSSPPSRHLDCITAGEQRQQTCKWLF